MQEVTGSSPVSPTITPIQARNDRHDGGLVLSGRRLLWSGVECFPSETDADLARRAAAERQQLGVRPSFQTNDDIGERQVIVQALGTSGRADGGGLHHLARAPEQGPDFIERRLAYLRRDPVARHPGGRHELAAAQWRRYREQDGDDALHDHSMAL